MIAEFDMWNFLDFKFSKTNFNSLEILINRTYTLEREINLKKTHDKVISFKTVQKLLVLFSQLRA